MRWRARLTPWPTGTAWTVRRFAWWPVRIGEWWIWLERYLETRQLKRDRAEPGASRGARWVATGREAGRR